MLAVSGPRRACRQGGSQPSLLPQMACFSFLFRGFISIPRQRLNARRPHAHSTASSGINMFSEPIPDPQTSKDPPYSPAFSMATTASEMPSPRSRAIEDFLPELSSNSKPTEISFSTSLSEALQSVRSSQRARNRILHVPPRL